MGSCMSGPVDAPYVENSRKESFKNIMKFFDDIVSSPINDNICKTSLVGLKPMFSNYMAAYITQHSTKDLKTLHDDLLARTLNLHNDAKSNRQTMCVDKSGAIINELKKINLFNSGVHERYGGGGGGIDAACAPFNNKFGFKFIDDRGEFKRGVAVYKETGYVFTSSGIEYPLETIISEMKNCDPSTTEITITTQDVQILKVHVRTSFLDDIFRPYSGTQNAGSSRKKEKAAPRWISTGRKVTTKDGHSRVAFRNAAGELRVRKVTVGKDGKRTTRYITF